jgi:hypothetical protein
MCQGQAISLLLRGYETFGDPRFLEVAESAVGAFSFSVADDGVMSELEDGSLFIQEVVGDPHLYILNGCLFGIVGLVEYSDLYPSRRLRQTLKRCSDGVHTLLPLFDTGRWSRYALAVRANISSLYYHRLHVEQLRYLGVRLKEPTLTNYAERFATYLAAEGKVRAARWSEVAGINYSRVLRALRMDALIYRTVVPGTTTRAAAPRGTPPLPARSSPRAADRWR